MGGDVPGQEQEIAAEVAAARTVAAMADRSERGRLVVRGNDRLTFLHNMLSNAISTLEPGSGCRAELLDDHGHVVGDLRVFVATDHVLIDLEPGRAELVREALDKFVIMDDVTIEDVTATLVQLTLVGPKAADVLRAVLGAEAPRAMFEHRTAVLAGIEARIAHTRFTGPDDYDVFVPAGQAAQARTMLQTGVIAAGGALLSTAAFEILRVEAGVARQGADIDDKVIALEAGLDKDGAISFTKGCYLGQEVMARIDSRGHVNRLLVGLALAGDGAPPAPGTPIRAGEKDVGRVTSAVFSPTLSKTIALGYVRREHAEPGSALTVGEASAVVAALPFVS